MRLFSRWKGARPFELSPGDRLVLHRRSGELHLVKVSGEQVDLNAASGGDGILLSNFTTLAFLQLCSLLAASYGQAASTVHDRGGGTLTCAVHAPAWYEQAA